jgi:hypothetical protein
VGELAEAAADEAVRGPAEHLVHGARDELQATAGVDDEDQV